MQLSERLQRDSVSAGYVKSAPVVLFAHSCRKHALSVV